MNWTTTPGGFTTQTELRQTEIHNYVFTRMMLCRTKKQKFIYFFFFVCWSMYRFMVVIVVVTWSFCLVCIVCFNSFFVSHFVMYVLCRFRSFFGTNEFFFSFLNHQYKWGSIYVWIRAPTIGFSVYLCFFFLFFSSSLSFFLSFALSRSHSSLKCVECEKTHSLNKKKKKLLNNKTSGSY